MTIPVLHAGSLRAADVGAALREQGGFLLDPSIDPALCQRALAAARGFFALPPAMKATAAIARSPHFRGWSEMHNQRDWREQFHFGRERAAAAVPPEHNRLEGPNLWPPDEVGRAAVLAYLDAAAALGEALLGLVARDLGLPRSPFENLARDGYLLLKLIGYHPQPTANVQRPGVAAHVDFSWITLTLQDSPGLELQGPDGTWSPVEPRDGAIAVHAGELLDFASGGRYRATPHRVVNPSLARTRVSLPLFLNPPLDAEVTPLCESAEVARAAQEGPGEHVHRVLGPGTARVPFTFGPAEWRRKGQNAWCYLCAPGPAS